MLSTKYVQKPLNIVYLGTMMILNASCPHLFYILVGCFRKKPQKFSPKKNLCKKHGQTKMNEHLFRDLLEKSQILHANHMALLVTEIMNTAVHVPQMLLEFPKSWLLRATCEGKRTHNNSQKQDSALLFVSLWNTTIDSPQLVGQSLSVLV